MSTTRDMSDREALPDPGTGREAEARQALRQAMRAIQVLEGRLRAKDEAARAPIAVIGLGCRFPGGITDADGFWRVLRDGVDVVREIPPHRWDIDAIHDPRPLAPGKIVSRFGAVLDRIDGFDAAFFGISPREAAAMDPQQRLMLEVARETFDHAGLTESRLAGSPTGVFVGLSESEYAWAQHAGLEGVDSYTATGAYGGIVANRVSYLFDLKGPSFTVDSICSSSLLAVHQAVESIRRGECEQALAGGVCVLTGPDQMIWLSKLGVLSQAGRCRAFDADGDGIVLGEGCGAVMLKRLDLAERDGDRVLAVIRGSAAGQDGRSNGMTAPSRQGQEAVIRRAYAQAGIDPRHVGYVDGHGTGTKLGDPIEARALGAVVGAGRGPGDFPCRLGSVKTNIAHLGPVGGVASLIKVVLGLRHRTIPPSLHFTTPNPDIPFEALRLDVPVRALDWPEAEGGGRIGAVTSLAFGGTNVHVVLSEAPAPPPLPAAADRPRPDHLVLPLSARSPEGLAALAQDWAGRMAACAGPEELAALAANQAVRRDAEPWRAALVIPPDPALAEAALAALAGGRDAPDLHRSGQAVRGRRAGPVFVCSGHGAQYAGMALGLMETAPVFRERIATFEAAMRPYVDWSLTEELGRAGRGGALLERTDMIQPALCAIQIALAGLWQSLGVRPAAVVGNSMGEVAAAQIAGALDLDQAARIICLRTRLVARAAQGPGPKGGMLMVDLDLDAARRLIAGREASVAIAVAQSPRATVLSGEAGALAALAADLDGRGVFNRSVKVDFASHSPLVDALRPDLLAALDGLAPTREAIPFVSTVRGTGFDGRGLDARYWADNLREPVLFRPAVESLLAEGHRTFLELAPHPLLTVALQEIATEAGAGGVTVLASQRRDESAWKGLLEAAARLHVGGTSIDWTGLYGTPPVETLPAVPWQRERFWLPDISAAARPATPAPLARTRVALPEAGEVWAAPLPLDPETRPWLRDHTVFGAATVPAAAVIDALAGLVPGAALAELRFELPLAPGDIAVIRGAGPVLTVFARGEGETEWRPVAAAWAAPGSAPAPLDPEALAARLDQVVRGADFHAALADGPAGYGPAFRALAEIRWAEGEALARLSPPVDRQPDGILLDPPLLDAALQATFQTFGADPVPLLPAAVAALAIHRPCPAGEDLLVHAVRRGGEADAPLFDLTLADARGMPVATLAGLRMRRPLPPARPLIWEIVWSPAAGAAPMAGVRVALLGGGGAAETLAAPLRAAGHVVLGGDDLDTADAVLTLDTATAPGPEALDAVAALLRACATRTRPLRILVPSVRAVTAAGTTPDPVAALAWGFVRAAALERPDLDIVMVDLDGADLTPLADLIGRPDLPAQLALRGGDLLAARLEPVGGVVGAAREPAGDRDFALRLPRIGRSDDLSVIQEGRPEPGPGTVAVAVEAAGLNFMDVARALGLVRFAAETEHLRFGMECAGRITALGAGVEGLRVGDPVIAVTGLPGTIRRTVIVDARLVAPRPTGLDTAAAAGQPIAFVTAWHALVERADLSAGETVLVPSAAGGVGLAAVAIARARGAHVVATAGSEEKRAFLRGLGLTQVFDSRDPGAAAAIRAAVGPVDVVLNAATGAAAEAHLGLLGPYGRFVEIGKADQQAGARIAAASLGRNVGYHAVDIAALIADRPDRIAGLLARLGAMLAEGSYPPLPVAALPLAAAADAFDRMARARHVGKLVLTLADPGAVSIRPDPAAALAGAHVLVTGGTGGVGLTLARWAAGRGAAAVSLLARSDPSPEAEATIATLRGEGVRVAAFRADATRSATLGPAIRAAQAQAGLPVDVLVHGAAALDDGLAADLDPARLRIPLAPKVAGTHALLDALGPLRLVLLMSSTAAILGAAGQANYAAANAYLDALAPALAARGVPTVSVGWGPWAAVGGVARLGLGENFARRGQRPLDPAEALAGLDGVLASGRTAAAVTHFDPARWCAAHPRMGASLLPGARRPVNPEAGGLTDRLRAAPPEARIALMTERLRGLVARVLGIAPERIDPRRDTLGTLGLDSLMSLELRNRLEAETALRLPATLAWNFPVFSALAGHLIGLLGLSAAEPAPTPAPGEAGIEALEDLDAMSEIEGMSEEEAEAELVRRLALLETGHAT